MRRGFWFKFNRNTFQILNLRTRNNIILEFKSTFYLNTYVVIKPKHSNQTTLWLRKENMEFTLNGTTRPFINTWKMRFLRFFLTLLQKDCFLFLLMRNKIWVQVLQCLQSLILKINVNYKDNVNLCSSKLNRHLIYISPASFSCV